MIVGVSPAAAFHGIRPALSAAEAKALCPNLRLLPEDAAGDARALAALGRWMIRFTPIVSIGWEDDQADIPPPALLLDLTGTERLFGGMHRLVHRIKRSLAGFNIPSQIALAPTPGAAWAFAFASGSATTMIDALSLPSAILPLPIETLRIDETILNNLHDLGVHRIGELLALPREQLPARFGPLLSKRLDQLLGVLVEPLAKLINEPPISAHMEFDAPINEIEDIWRIFQKLLGLAVAELASRNHGVRSLRLIFKPDPGWGESLTTRTILISRPHRNLAALLNLIRCESERVHCRHGFVRFQLDIPQHEPIAETQKQLFEQKADEEAMEFDHLLQRLRVRLGEPAVIQPTWVESYLPERAWRPAKENEPAILTAIPPPRPLTLFPMPMEIRVVCEPSDDYIGEPRQFTWGEMVHRLAHAVGPERIAGEWWRGHLHTRDYYDVEDDAGRRFWLFRVTQRRPDGRATGRWFLHGRFD